MIGPDEWRVVLPEIVNLGSAYAGRRCRVIRMMALGGPVGTEEIGRHLGVPKQVVHETITRMQAEGTIFWMDCSGRKRLFLADRPGWLRMMAGTEGDSPMGRAPGCPPFGGMGGERTRSL